jgi:hypothetical protein
MFSNRSIATTGATAALSLARVDDGGLSGGFPIAGLDGL